MKRFRVVSCAICFLLAAVVLAPCALASSQSNLSATVICPITGNSFEVTGDQCGPVKDFPAYCPYCKENHNFDVTLSHDWNLGASSLPTTESEGYKTYICFSCGETKTVIIPILPPEPPNPDVLLYMNWLGSVLSLFSMTLNSIMAFPALRMFAGVLVFLIVFSLLAKLLRQGRRGQL